MMNLQPLTWTRYNYSMTIFIQYFLLLQGTPQSVLDTQSSDHTLPIDDIQLSESDVLDLHTSLDTSKACGVDTWSPKLF